MNIDDDDDDDDYDDDDDDNNNDYGSYLRPFRHTRVARRRLQTIEVTLIVSFNKGCSISCIVVFASMPKDSPADRVSNSF